MDTPPPFQGAPRRGRANWLVITLAALALLCLCCGGGTFWCSRNAMPMAGCMLTYGLTLSAVKDYAADHEGKLPPAANWQSEIAPYYKKLGASEDLPQKNPFINIELADIDQPMGCYDGGRAVTGMAYNTDVAGKKLSEIAKPRETPIFFEVPEAKLNLATKYVEQDPKQAPKMFGQGRGWLLLTADGEVEMVTEKGRTKVDFDTGATRRTRKDAEKPAPADEAPKEEAPK